MKSPPSWTQEELEAGRQKAIAAFRKVRVEEPLTQYLEFFERYQGLIEDLLTETADLTQLRAHLADLLGDKEGREAVRFLTGPPISLDDLKIVAEANSVRSKQKLRGDPAMLERVTQVILTGLDRGRFPWIIEGRVPTELERGAASMASAALMAYSKLQTKRRIEGKKIQEAAVISALSGNGFKEIGARPIQVLSDGPGPGEFCREAKLGTRKADVVVGLWDRRVMPIECKVSNSFLNSVKRLNNDAAVKSVVWLNDFGARQVVPSAVIAGVFWLSKLVEAQDRGLALFWAHDLRAMLEWIESTKQ